jgi:hypothetical protein
VSVHPSPCRRHSTSTIALGQGRVTQPAMRGGGGQHHATLLRVGNTTRLSFAHPRARERRMGGGEEARVVRMRKHRDPHTEKICAREKQQVEKRR